MDPKDIEKVLARTYEGDSVRLWIGGLRYKDLSKWSWEQKYSYFNSPNKITKADLVVAYSKGMLRKSGLEHGAYFFGLCRNARIARFNAHDGHFYYQRNKLGHIRTEKIKHPEDADEDSEDVFQPSLLILSPLPHEIVHFDDVP